MAYRWYASGSECGAYGFPITNARYDSAYRVWTQDFNCGYMQTYGSSNQYVYSSFHRCVF